MLLQTTSLTFAYPGQATISFPDISLAAGEALLLLGQSGSGKTTLLNLLAGLLTPSQGSVMLDEVNLSALKGHRLDLFRGQHIGIVFQKPHLIAALSVKQNLELAQFFGKKKLCLPSYSINFSSVAKFVPSCLLAGRLPDSMHRILQEKHLQDGIPCPPPNKS